MVVNFVGPLANDPNGPIADTQYKDGECRKGLVTWRGKAWEDGR